MGVLGNLGQIVAHSDGAHTCGTRRGHSRGDDTPSSDAALCRIAHIFNGEGQTVP